MSASVAAKHMNEKGWRSDCAPITRNSIIGVWARKSEKKDTDIKKTRVNIHLRNKTRTRDVEKNKVNFPAQQIPENGLAFEQIGPGNCRFPYGDPTKEALRYCGHPIDYSKGASYCQMHYKLCYYPPRKSR
jgi:hypothetical protein